MATTLTLRGTKGSPLVVTELDNNFTSLANNKFETGGDTLTGQLNYAPILDMASAGTMNIGAAPANIINVTGAATVTAFDTIASGAERRLQFSGVVTLTHNATNLILPSAANITTAIGDNATFLSLGAGNWRCTSYQKASGQALVAAQAFVGGTLTTALNYSPTASLAASTTTGIGSASSNSVIITGTNSITGFDSLPSGAERLVTFNGVLTLTHNATSLILPAGANIITAVGDTAYFVSLGGGNWRCTSYQKANGQAVSVTSFTGGTLSSALNYAPAVSIASASTTGIGAAASNAVTITGTTTITAFDNIASAAERVLTFASALTLTHNGVSLILPSGANITTTAGDTAYFISLGGGNWKCTAFLRANGQGIAPTAGVLNGNVSATVIDKGSVSTGTVTFDVSKSPSQKLIVAGSLTIAFSGWQSTGIETIAKMQLINAGAAGNTVTLPTLNWQLPAGGYTTNFQTYLTAIGRTSLQATGTDWLIVWSVDGGTTVYAKLV